MVLSKQDLVFINEINQRFPYLRENFERALAVPANDRFEWAQEEIYNVQRSGYAVRGIPAEDVESVGEHTAHCIVLADVWIENAASRRETILTLEGHDLEESIILDFHWKSPITKGEKERLEKLASNVLYEADPRQRRVYSDLYREGESPVAKLAKDFDKLQVLFKAAVYERQFPALKNALDEFWGNVEGIVETPTGKRVLEYALSNREKIANRF